MAKRTTVNRDYTGSNPVLGKKIMLFEKKKKSDLALKRSIFNKSSNKGTIPKFYIKGAQLFKTTPQKFKRIF